MEVVVVPTRRGTCWSLGVCFVLACAVTGLGLSVLVGNLLWVDNPLGAYAFGLLVAVAAVVAGSLFRSFVKHCRAARKCRAGVDENQSPLWRLIAQCNRRSDNAILRELNRMRPKLFGPASPPPLLVCLGVLPSEPEPSEYQTEPSCYEVHHSFRPFGWMLIGALILIGAIDWLAVPSPATFYARQALVALCGVLAIGGVVYLACFSWRTVLRVSPGVVEVFRYPIFGSKPRVHRYPCVPGTTLILRCVDPPDGEPKDAFLSHHHSGTLTLSRGKHVETIPLTGIKPESLCRAVTAERVTPLEILSTDSLIG